MAVLTTSTTTANLKNFWQNFFISNLYDKRVFDGLTKKTKVGKGQGKICWWYGIGKVNPVGAAATEGSDPTPRSASASRISGTLTEYVNLIKASRLYMDVAIDGTREQILKELAYDAANLMDNNIRDVAIAGGTPLFGGSATHRSNIVEATTATIKDIRKALRLLELSSVDRWADGLYVGLVHPDVAFDLMSDSAWIDINKYRDTVKYDLKGEVGQLYGVRFISTPKLTVLLNSGSGNTDVYRSLIFGPEYLGESELGNLEVVINEPGKGTELNMYNTYGYRFVHASAVLKASRCVRLETNSSLA
jgi:N4-gp56 family major capsid protein